jgi:hypothetical protein
MGIFGAVSQDDSSAYVPIVRFEPTVGLGEVKELPGRLIEPQLADPVPASPSGGGLMEMPECRARRTVECARH